MTPRRPIVPALLAASVLLLAGCATTGGAGGAGGTGGSGGASASAAAACASVAGGGYELFVDPRLTVDPVLDVYPLAKAGDKVSFTDTDPGESTYSYSSYYIDDGKAFPNDAAIFVGAEDTNEFKLDGPFAPSGVDGGPYPGIIEIEATDASTEVIARICVQLAASD